MNAENTPSSKFVGAKELLKILFSDESRPSLRWLRDQQAGRRIPFVRLGRLVFFDPDQVRVAMNERLTVKPRRL